NENGDASAEWRGVVPSSTAERAIHFAEGEQFTAVLWRHAPSVEDRHAPAILVPPQRREPRSNVPVRLAGLRRGGGLAGPDRPDRLVGDHDLRALVLVNARQCLRQLRSQHRLGLIAGALVPRLANAEDRP